MTRLDELGFWRIASRTPDEVAVVDVDGSVVTRGELLARANAVSHLLRQRGLQPGDRVVGVLANEPGALSVALACQQVGAYFVPVNTALTPGEVAYVVADAAPVVAVVSRVHAETVTVALDQAGYEPGRRYALGPTVGFVDLTAAVAGLPTHAPAERTPGTYLGYTSGTTGRPKGVVRALAQGDPDDVFAAGADWQLGMFGFEPLDGNVHLVTSPLSHTAVSGIAVASLHFGHVVVLTDRFDAEGTLRLIERHRVTTTHMVPTQLHRLLRLPNSVRTAYDVTSMRSLVHGAGPCSETVKRAVIDWFGPVVWEYYGATEAAGTAISSVEWLSHPGSVGRPQPGADVRILDESGDDVSTGTSGLVYLKMGSHAFTYRGDAAKTAATRRGDYVTVGDLGYLDDQGYLSLRGRTAEVVVSGGVNVYPAEVEAALLDHPEVADVAVVAAEDPEWGESVHAVVEPVPGSALGADPVAGGADVVAFLRPRLARYKIPRHVTFVERLPRADNGKLRKHLLPTAVPGEER